VAGTAGHGAEPATGGSSADGGGPDEGLGGAAGGEGTVARFRPMPNPVTAGLPNPAKYDTSQSGVVLDELTALVWQATPDPAYYSIDEGAGVCEALVLSGKTDWRLPSRLELVSLIDFTVEEPTIDRSAFGAKESGSFLSSSAAIGAPGVWYVDFVNGRCVRGWKFQIGRVRCVRGEPFAPKFEIGLGDLQGTVADATTGLVWQQDATSDYLSMEEASSYCGSLTLAGSQGWRLPSVKELLVVADDSHSVPAIDETLFGPEYNVQVLFPFTTSSTVFGAPGLSWQVDFLDGHTQRFASPAYVRCVR